MKNYNKKYKKRKRGKVKAQSRNEFRKHKPSGHYKYVFLKTNKGYKFLGITHSDKASNYGPVSNPDPKSEDPRPVYVETEWEEDSESHFDSVQKGWKFSDQDQIEVIKIIKRNKKKKCAQ